jgi:hypothetical protein
VVEAFKTRKTLRKVKMEIMKRYHTDKHEASLKEKGMVKAREIQGILNEICNSATKVFDRVVTLVPN